MGWVAAGLAPRLILPSKAKEVKLFVFIVLQTPSLSVPDRRGYARSQFWIPFLAFS
jgi:hypothetical protein